MLIVILIISGLGGFLGLWFWYWFTNLAKFLNLCAPIEADTLVIEGWVPDKTLAQAAQIFWQEGYKTIITTGPPVDYGYFLSEYKTQAQLSAATLEHLGIPESKIIPLSCPTVEKFRTYTSALAVKQFYESQPFKPRRINLFSSSCHARRSWYIYHQLFAAANIAVGVVATKPYNFDPDHWWKTSAGVRTVVGEFIAYSYVRLVNWRN